MIVIGNLAGFSTILRIGKGSDFMLAIDKAILSYAAVAAVAAVAIWMFPVAIAYGYQNPVTAPAVKVINSEAETWELLETVGSPTARHEATFVAFKNKIYLLGGRRINPVDVFDPQTSTWTAKSKSPIELHHFQAVVYDELIYLIGAMTGPYPNEKPVQRVVSYDPAEDKFKFSHPIPVDRRRGGAGAVVRNGKIYIVGGIVNGHLGGYQPWLDEYDPRTGKWRILADAPDARDHFQAATDGNRLYAVGGRMTSKKTDDVFNLTVGSVNVFDFDTETWLADQPPNLPTERAGNMAFIHNGYLIVGGGETTQDVAHNDVEMLDLKSWQWSKLPRLAVGRHGSGFAVVGNYVYTASGCGMQGGSDELTSIERMQLPVATDADRRQEE